MAEGPILSVRNLRTEFQVGRRSLRAVQDVSFELARGRMLGIVGESGCGKSVTAHSVMQLLPKAGRISGGSIHYVDGSGRERVLSAMERNGREIRSVRGREIAMIFQDPMSSLDPVYGIGHQIAENLLEHERLDRGEARARVVALLAELGIPIPEKRYDDYPHQFSGGMKQRAMIAMAMICNPRILIADEPTTALDVTIQAQILALMKQLQERHGTSVILITHNMGIVAETCDEVGVMYMGRIVELGSLEQIFNAPRHPYTAALLRSVPVLGLGGRKELESIRGTTPDASTVFEGCEFEPRCDRACPRCAKESAPERILDGSRRVRCWLYA